MNRNPTCLKVSGCQIAFRKSTKQPFVLANLRKKVLFSSLSLPISKSKPVPPWGESFGCRECGKAAEGATLQGHCPGKGAGRVEEGSSSSSSSPSSSSSSAITEERETVFFRNEGNRMGAVFWKEREVGLKQENLRRGMGVVSQ